MTRPRPAARSAVAIRTTDGRMIVPGVCCAPHRCSPYIGARCCRSVRCACPWPEHLMATRTFGPPPAAPGRPGIAVGIAIAVTGTLVLCGGVAWLLITQWAAVLVALAAIAGTAALVAGLRRRPGTTTIVNVTNHR